MDVEVRAENALQVAVIGNRASEAVAIANEVRLVWFLAAVYNGPEYLFDLTELRALASALANACLDYLNYNRLGRREVHRHLSSGDTELQRWIDDYGLLPRGTLRD